MNAQLNPFTEDRPEFNGFSSFYYDEIFPFLHSKEQVRLKKIGTANIAALAVFVAFIALAVFVYTRTGTLAFPLFMGVFAIFGGYIARVAVMAGLQGETKAFVMGKICDVVGWSFAAQNFLPPDLRIWQDNKLRPSYDRVKFEDQMEGNAHGVPFRFCEAHLEDRRKSDKGSKWVTVFRGV